MAATAEETTHSRFAGVRDGGIPGRPVGRLRTDPRRVRLRRLLDAIYGALG